MSNSGLGEIVTLEQLAGKIYPTLHGLRATEPVAWVPALDAWLVTRRDLAVEVMRDVDTYTVDHPGFSTARVFGPSMLSVDGARHERYRTPFEPMFRRPVVRDQLGPVIAAHVDAVLDGLLATEAADLRRDFAAPVAGRTMASVLGLGVESVDAMLGWYDTFLAGITAVTAGEPVGPEVADAFAALRAHVGAARPTPADPTLLGAVAASGTLSDEELVANVGVLLFGGIETTEGTIATALFHLLRDPERTESVRAELDGGGVTLLERVVEEALRIEPAAAVVDRYATTDTVLDGVAIRAGDLVSVSLTAANRDPATFPDPDRFDPHRDNLGRHLTFAQGPHVCLGLHLARLETRLALEGAMRRLPDLTLSDPAGSAPSGLVFRKPQSLPATWTAPKT